MTLKHTFQLLIFLALSLTKVHAMDLFSALTDDADIGNKELFEDDDIKRKILKYRDKKDNNSFLHQALIDPNPKLIAALVECAPGLKIVTNKSGKTPYNLAVDLGLNDTIKSILQ